MILRGTNTFFRFASPTVRRQSPNKSSWTLQSSSFLLLQSQTQKTHTSSSVPFPSACFRMRELKCTSWWIVWHQSLYNVVSISLPIHCQSQSFTVLCARQRLISICSKIGVIWAHSLVTPFYRTILFKVFFLINWEGKHFRKNHFAHPAIEILNVRCYL